MVELTCSKFFVIANTHAKLLKCNSYGHYKSFFKCRSKVTVKFTCTKSFENDVQNFWYNQKGLPIKIACAKYESPPFKCISAKGETFTKVRKRVHGM